MLMQQQEHKKIRRIKQISVKNLFGMFNYTIPFHMNDRITIIHGPNGFGKTVILRLLKSLFSHSNLTLRTIPFEEFGVYFDDNTSFWVTKSPLATKQFNASKKEENLYKITFQATNEPPYSLPQKSSFSSTQLPISQLSVIERMIPFLDRIDTETWRNLYSGEIYSLEDVLENFSDQLPPDFTRELEKEAEWLTKLRASVPIRFIETQRLLIPSKTSRRTPYDRQFDNAVNEYSKHLVDVIRKKLTEYATLSQSLDSTFPKRLVSPTAIQRETTESELRNKLAELENKRSRLMAAGLLDQDTNSTFQLEDEVNESTKVVLNVYVEDTENKLKIFDELADKIDLLTKIINKRFLYKQMTISREEGFVLITQDGTNLPYTSLSSGEQHELVLLYELLFEATPGSLILLDEPEISLHVVWQEKFLTDLQEITRLANLDALVATHSPDIIHDRRDLVVLLEGPK